MGALCVFLFGAGWFDDDGVDEDEGGEEAGKHLCCEGSGWVDLVNIYSGKNGGKERYEVHPP